MLIRLLLLLPLISAQTLSADDKVSIRARIQPRIDFGDISRSADRSTYQSEADLYLRRTRLEMVGRPTDQLLYVLAFVGDRWDQKGRENEAILGFAFIDYRFSKKLALQVGLTKLPYSRSALTSSSRQLFIERPLIIGLGTSLLKYRAPHIILHGKLAGGKLAYNFALTDGLEPGDADRAHSRKEVVKSGDLGVVGRIELAPAGWIEGRKSDSHLGQGRHLSLGLNSAFQDGLELEDIGKERRFLLGADLSFQLESLTLTAEYIYINRDSATQIEPSGFFVQGGYFFKALKIEPAARFAMSDSDTNSQDMDTKAFTGGINWYISGHELKLQANISHHIFDKGVREVSGQGSKTVFQLQNQMYF